MKTTELRQLIKESIQEYIREIDAAGNRAALEAKIAKTQEAIDLRKKKLNMEGLDEAYHDMMDKGKMKEMTSEIKLLEKSIGKYKKMLEKMDAKDTPKMEEMQDTDEMEMDPASGPQLEEELRAGVYNDFTKWKESFPEGTKFEQVDNYIIAKDTASKELGKWNPMSKTGMHVDDFQYKSLEERKKMTTTQKAKKEDIVKGMKKSKSFGKSKEEKAKMYATATKLAMKENKQFLHMQKLAGLITETQYKEKMRMLNEVEIKVGSMYVYEHPKAGPVKVKVLGKSEWGDEYFTVEALEDKGEVKKGNQYNAEIEKLTVTESEYKQKLNENETAETLYQMFKDKDLLDDRREYDVEDLMSAYPGLSKEEAEKLYKKLRKK